MAEGSCVLELRFKRAYGERDTVIAVDMGPEHRLMPEKEAIIMGPVAVASFDTAVKIMRQRQITGDMVRDAAARLGRLMAERLEDEAGWHGDDRREKTRALRG